MPTEHLHKCVVCTVSTIIAAPKGKNRPNMVGNMQNHAHIFV